MANTHEQVTPATISILAIIGSNRGISTNAELVWNIGQDTDWFDRKTKGKVIVMSWETFERMGSKPLPDRINVVVNKSSTYKVPKGVILCRSITEVIQEFNELPEIVVVGGAQTYKKFIPTIDRLYLAKVDLKFDATRFFPELDWDEWELIEHVKRTPEVGLSYSFNTYQRKGRR